MMMIRRTILWYQKYSTISAYRIRNIANDTKYTTIKYSTIKTTQQQQQEQHQQHYTKPPPAPSSKHGMEYCYLDLRGMGISILERLVIEEYILKHHNDNRHWIIIGTHTPTPHRYLTIMLPKPIQQHQQHEVQNHTDISYDTMDDTGNNNNNNNNNSINDTICIVMGIGGKVHELVHVPHVLRDQVQIIKRFTGGGTVILDYNSIWCTIIGRPTTSTSTATTTASIVPLDDSDNIKNESNSTQIREPLHHPRPIMEYTANVIYQPIFERLQSLQNERVNVQNKTNIKKGVSTLIVDSKSCSFDNTGRLYSHHSTQTIKSNDTETQEITTLDNNQVSYQFALRENDYILTCHSKDINTNTNTSDKKIHEPKYYKMGGNAQAITKHGYIHHTSFLWDYDKYNMKEYLLLPKKRPLYRADRDHTNFLISLQNVYPLLYKNDFFTTMYYTCQTLFPSIQKVTLFDVMDMINNDPTIVNSIREGNNTTNGMNAIQYWYESKSRTRIVSDLHIQNGTIN